MSAFISTVAHICVLIHVLDARVSNSYFYSVEWTASIPGSKLITGDTLQIHHISLQANNHRNLVTPTITGINRPQYITDGYHNWTYPIANKFSVKWDFGGQPTPVGMIRVLTNCGYREPSSFCANSTFRFNTSNGRQAVQAQALYANAMNVALLKYDNECTDNVLLHDAERSESCKQWPCSECFNFMQVELDKDAGIITMRSSATYPSSSSSSLSSFSSSTSTAECTCPSFILEMAENDVLQIWNMDDDEVGAITAVLGEDEDDSRVQIQWTHWFGEDRRCRQYFLPNFDDFLRVFSYRGFGIHFNFNHTDGALFHYELENNTDLYESFQFELAEYFNTLFNLSWVSGIQIYELPNQSVPEQDIYAYEIWVPSMIQLDTMSVLELQTLYLDSVAEMYEGIEWQLADAFGTNSTFVQGLNGSHYIKYPNNMVCNPYFNDTTEQDPVIVAIEALPWWAVLIFVILALFFCILCLWTIVCYRRKLACFRPKWHRVDANKKKKRDSGELGIEGAEGESATNNTHAAGSNKMAAGEEDPAAHSVKPHEKTTSVAVSAPVLAFKPGHSIRITNVDEVTADMFPNSKSAPPDVASLRAQSLSKADSQKQSIVVSNGKSKLTIQKNVSQRVLSHEVHESASVYDYHIGSGAARRQLEDKVSYDYGNKSYPEPRPNQGHLVPAQVSYDYGKNSNQSGTTRNSDYYSYNPVAQQSSSASPESTPVRADQHDQNLDAPQHIQLTPIAQGGDDAENKIDDALNKAKRQNKVTEFTDFDKELKLIKLIGKGSFGKVYKAKWDAEFVAVKIFTNINQSGISTDKIDVVSSAQHSHSGHSSGKNAVVLNELQVTAIDDEQFKELYAEIVLATSMPPHPNIVSINGFCRKPLCVVMEYMAGGSVQKLVYGLTTKPQPSVAEKLVILIKACYGLQHLTAHGLHHRDVAARNILLGEYSKVIDDGTKVKITDFGMTRTDNEDGGDKANQKTKSDGGPYKWMAPESIQDQQYNEKTDVFMFGVTMWEIMYGREPYENVDAINAAMQVCMKDERPEFLWDLPSGLTTLIKKCWSKEPEQRPTFKLVARRLQKIESSMQSDIQENREMDEEVEQERAQQEKAEELYNQIDLGSSDNPSDGAYDAFSQ